MNCLPSSMIFLIEYFDLSRLPSSIPSGNMAVENPRTKWRFKTGKIIHTWDTFHCHVWCPEGSNTICKPSSQEAHHAVFCPVLYPHYISSPLSHPIPMSNPHDVWFTMVQLSWYTYIHILQACKGSGETCQNLLVDLNFTNFNEGDLGKVLRIHPCTVMSASEKWPTLDMPKRADSCQFALLFILRFVVINPICMRIKPQCWKKYIWSQNNGFLLAKMMVNHGIFFGPGSLTQLQIVSLSFSVPIIYIYIIYIPRNC